MQGLRQEEVRERQKRGGIDSFRQLGETQANCAFLKLEPRERQKDGAGGWEEKMVGEQQASFGTVPITMCSNNTKEQRKIAYF